MRGYLESSTARLPGELIGRVAPIGRIWRARADGAIISGLFVEGERDMTMKRLMWVLVIGVMLFVGVKFSLVYVNYLQLKNIMSSEALDARRSKATEGEIESAIWSRVDASSAFLPEDVEFDFEGVGRSDEDLVVYADYTETVDLVVTKVPMKMSITAVAEPPAF